MSRNVDRRGFLRVAGGAAAGTCLAGGVAAAERDRARTGDAVGGRRAGTKLWREYLAAPDTHTHVPNVSYAGYHRGEDRLPQLPVRATATEFGAIGDGRADSTAALNAAVEAVGRAGGGAVLVPADRGGLDAPVRRGAARSQPAAHHPVLRRVTGQLLPGAVARRVGVVGRNGLVHPPGVARRARAARLPGQRGLDGQPRAVDGQRRGAWRVPVADPSAFTAGEHVLLLVDNPTDNMLLAHLAGDVPGTRTYPWETAARRLRPELSTWVLAENFRYNRYPVQVAAVEPDAIALAQPVRVDLRLGWRPRFATLGPVVAESGIEDLTIEMREITQRAHHQDPGFNGPNFQAALNCWSRPAPLVHLPGGGHLRLAQGAAVRQRAHRDPSGQHRGTGGAGDAGPRWGARFCHWNIDVRNGRSQAIRLDEHAPMSAMVAVLGTTGPTNHTKDLCPGR